MEKYLRWAGTAAGLLFILLFYMLAVRKTADLKECEGAAVIIAEPSLTVQQVDIMSRQEEKQDLPCDFAAWYQENNVTAENSGLRRQHTVSVVTVRGKSDMLLRGNVRLDTDQEGECLIDEKTALELFGSVSVDGLTLEMNGEVWTVRGILYDAVDTVLCEAKGDAEKNFDMLTVGMPGNTFYESVRQDFMMRHGLAGQLIPMNTLWVLAGLFCLLIPVTAGMRILCQCARAVYVYSRNNSAMILGVGVVVLASLFLLWILSQVQLPPDLAPAKWSDLSYWADWWQRQKEALLLLLLTEKQRPVQPYLMEFYQAAALCLAGFIAALKTPFSLNGL